MHLNLASRILGTHGTVRQPVWPAVSVETVRTASFVNNTIHFARQVGMRPDIHNRRGVPWLGPGARLPISNTLQYPTAFGRLPFMARLFTAEYPCRLEALGSTGGLRYNQRTGRERGPNLTRELNASANWNANDWVKSATEFESDKYYPDITILSQAEQKALLPWLPTSGQLQWFQANDPGQAWVQWMAALIFLVVASKTPAIALAGALYPLYSKQIRAAVKNAKTRLSGYEYVGMWHTKLQHASVVQQPFTTTAATQGVPPSPSLCVRVGDDGLDSFSTELDFPWVPGCQSIAPGDRVEVLVLAKTFQFSDFKVLREVYFPDLNLFLSDYPFLKREAFQQISTEIERSRAGDTSSRDADAYW